MHRVQICTQSPSKMEQRGRNSVTWNQIKQEQCRMLEGMSLIPETAVNVTRKPQDKITSWRGRRALKSVERWALKSSKVDQKWSSNHHPSKHQFMHWVEAENPHAPWSTMISAAIHQDLTFRGEGSTDKPDVWGAEKRVMTMRNDRQEISKGAGRRISVTENHRQHNHRFDTRPRWEGRWGKGRRWYWMGDLSSSSTWFEIYETAGREGCGYIHGKKEHAVNLLVKSQKPQAKTSMFPYGKWWRTSRLSALIINQTARLAVTICDNVHIRSFIQRRNLWSRQGSLFGWGLWRWGLQEQFLGGYVRCYWNWIRYTQVLQWSAMNRWCLRWWHSASNVVYALSFLLSMCIGGTELFQMWRANRITLNGCHFAENNSNHKQNKPSEEQHIMNAFIMIWYAMSWSDHNGHLMKHIIMYLNEHHATWGG